jgi:FkbM family methyltransferase
MANFALTRGRSVRERGRLIYYSGFKPALAYRGAAKFDGDRILSFSTRVGKGRVFNVHARDNGYDVTTFAEFFSAQYVIIPPELPPMVPKVIWDIGANIGVASLYFAMHYPNARLYGFEPVPANYEVCQLNYKNLPGGKVFPWAVGASSGTATFEMRATDPRGGGLGKNFSGTDTSIQKFDVRVRSISDLLDEDKLEPPDLVKIDVEGAELEVLRGIGSNTTKLKRMLVETHGLDLEQKCLAWLTSNGFVVRHSHFEMPGYCSIWCDRVD